MERDDETKPEGTHVEVHVSDVMGVTDKSIGLGVTAIPGGLIYGGWVEQYERMKRSLARLRQVYLGVPDPNLDRARDDLVHCFADILHLKDWLHHDVAAQATRTPRGQRLVDLFQPGPLNDAKEVALGGKHYGRDQKKKQNAAGPTSQSTRGVGSNPLLYATSWMLVIDSRTVDALDLAESAVQAWEVWLTSEGLITTN